DWHEARSVRRRSTLPSVGAQVHVLNRDSVAANDGGVRNPPWLFGILSIPYGVFNGILVVLIPFLLRKHGISPDRIANVIAISSIPNVWYFLWSPVVDTGLLRRTWVLFAAAVSGACGAIAIAAASFSLTQLTLLLLAGNVVAMLLSSARSEERRVGKECIFRSVQDG